MINTEAAIVQLYADEGEAKLFDGDLVVTIAHPPRMLTTKDVAETLRLFGYRVMRWRNTDWGKEANVSRQARKP
jgi:hypothetical protein